MQSTRSKNKDWLWPAVFFSGWGLYFLMVWARAFRIDSHGDVIAGHVNLWGDWAVHFTMGSAMAFRQLFLDQSPLLLGAPFRYPFVVNLLSALLVRAGVPFISAFVWPSFLLSLLILFCLYRFYRQVFDSSAIAVLASTLFLLNGGLGFFYVIQKALAAPHFWNALLLPAQTATRVDAWEIQWMSVIDSVIIPQRAFQLGFPAALACLTLVLQKKHPLWAGILWGLLPILHTHSFLAVSVILGCWMLGDFAQDASFFFKEKLSYWSPLFGTAFLFAIPSASYLGLLSHENNGGILWDPGWYASTFIGWSIFWAQNWGLMPVAALFGFTLWIRADTSKRTRQQKISFLIPFVVLFVLLNLFRFQPWIWDNTKLLVWASLGISGVAAYGISRERKIIAIPLFVLLTISGLMDAYRVQVPSVNENRMYTGEEWALADWARHNTPPDSLWLTAPYHNNWVFNLTGRKVLMTYEGWLWTHGYAFDAMKNEMTAMANNPQDLKLYERNRVDFIVMGPIEKRDWKWDEEKLSAFTPVKQTENYVIYSTKKALLGTNSSLPPGSVQ